VIGIVRQSSLDIVVAPFLAPLSIMFSAQNLGSFDFLAFPSQTGLLAEEELTLDTLTEDNGFEMPAVGKVCTLPINSVAEAHNARDPPKTGQHASPCPFSAPPTMSTSTNDCLKLCGTVDEELLGRLLQGQRAKRDQVGARNHHSCLPFPGRRTRRSRFSIHSGQLRWYVSFLSSSFLAIACDTEADGWPRRSTSSDVVFWLWLHISSALVSLLVQH